MEPPRKRAALASPETEDLASAATEGLASGDTEGVASVDTAGLASTLSHDEVFEISMSSLQTMFSYDRLLSDLPSTAVLEEILAQLSVQQGQAISLSIFRDQNPVLKIVVKPTATVRELKKAIRRNFELYLKRAANDVKISWKYVWKTYDLYYDGIILDDDNSKMEAYGVVNSTKLTFKKKKDSKKSTV